MRLLPSDPDIETLVGRIGKGDLDLQPDFQRGEVWSIGKRQRLIDSVLRDWHVPPVHVIQNSDHTVSVLDGQQRLAAIRDFVEGVFPVDGQMAPLDNRILQLDGLRFQDLPSEIQRRFLRFSIRLFTVVDYRPAEPGELFYRLNQMSQLSPAEQRNAFFGSTRRQVKTLAGIVEKLRLGHTVLGFSNARMAYDDVIARALLLLEAKTLRHKVTASALADRYRNDEPFSEEAVSGVQEALERMELAQRFAAGEIRLNRASALTWIVFLASAPKALDVPTGSDLSEFMARFELLRRAVMRDIYSSDLAQQQVLAETIFERNLFLRRALNEYSDRATSRVADVSSVVLRDLVLWVFLLSREFPISVKPRDPNKRRLANVLSSGSLSSGSGKRISLEDLADELDWGAQI